METTINNLVTALEVMKSRHGGDTPVQIFSYTGFGFPGIDEVRNHKIENVDDGWYFKEKGDVINIECYRDYNRDDTIKEDGMIVNYEPDEATPPAPQVEEAQPRYRALDSVGLALDTYTLDVITLDSNDNPLMDTRTPLDDVTNPEVWDEMSAEDKQKFKAAASAHIQISSNAIRITSNLD